MSWLYQGKPITPEDVVGRKAFVYIITNLVNGKQYIGQKKFIFTTHKKLKNKSRRQKILKPSDWEDYYGSSKELHADVEKHGKENFKREIIRLCDSKGEANYWELHEQIMTGALLKPDEYYNSYCGGRIHRSHVIKKSS